MEHIPLPDAAVDVVISNCVINLSTDKAAVIARAPESCGPVAASRSPTSSPMPTWTTPTRRDEELWTGCIAGALTGAVHRLLEAAGFTDVEILETHRVHATPVGDHPGPEAERSLLIRAVPSGVRRRVGQPTRDGLVTSCSASCASQGASHTLAGKVISHLCDQRELEPGSGAQHGIGGLGAARLALRTQPNGSIPARRRSSWSSAASATGVVSASATSTSRLNRGSCRRMSGVVTRPRMVPASCMTWR